MIRRRSVAVALAFSAGLGAAVSKINAEEIESRLVKTARLNYAFSYNLFLTDSACWIEGECSGPIGSNPQGNLSAAIDRLLQGVTKSLDLAIYGIRSQDWFVDRVRLLKKSGVKIRATVDQHKGRVGEWNNTDNFDYPDAFKLVNLLGRSLIKPDVNANGAVRTGSIMHNKFMVIDGKGVWTGTTNISDTCLGSGYNVNSSVYINSPDVAALFQDEFEQMYEQRLYGIHKHRGTRPSRFFFADGTDLQVLFSPQDHVLSDGIIPVIKDAQFSLDIGIFFLTSSQVADEIAAAKRRGVSVRIILDATGAGSSASQLKFLLKNGVDVRVENWGGKMHMKTAIADQRDVIIGSMNWSQAGSSDNDENLVIIRRNMPLARQLSEAFEYFWHHTPESSTPQRRVKAEGLDIINSCFDGLDNDYNGKTDSEDSACQS